ncbi:alpha/beta fold hydrolase [Candidatus Saccharibacteria bacterium]|nr:alpha/beta fold hydrolase [Candidatus Saccharibacteria bacterium]
MIKTLNISCAGYSIIADWYEGKNTDEIILILQGFASSRTRQSKFTDFMVEATGAPALVLDYTGHGDSPFDLKDTRPAQHLLEVINAYDWIKTNYPNARISVIGNSYGSFLSAHLSHYRDIEKLVLRAPAIYRPEAFYDLWSQRFADEDAYRKSITHYRTHPDEMKRNPLLQNVRQGPSLVVVHEYDEVVPVETSDVYLEAFGADKFVAQGFNHAVSQSNISEEQLTDYHQKISDWLKAF